jgi:hypothetical protein
MRRIAMLSLATALFAAMAMADTWTGRLVDAKCVAQNASPGGAQKSGANATCDVNSSTTSFAIESQGKHFNLDATGNSKAAEAIKNRADRSKEPAGAASAAVMATVTGTASGDTIKVDSISVR